MATQTITFNKEGDQYVARFEAAEDFALHIERDQVGPINVEVSTIQGAGFAPVDDFPLDARNRPVLDYEFQGLVYPKYIKVTSDTAPAVAEVVSNGEIVALNYQEKSLQLTANGTTEVIPDAGFAGLTKVNVSVNVPQSGGESADIYMEYFGEDAVTALSAFPVPPASLLLMLGTGGVVTLFKSSDSIAPAMILSTDEASTLELKGFAIVFGTRSVIMSQDTGFVTPESLNSGGMAGFYDTIKDHKITKEEFYNLNA